MEREAPAPKGLQLSACHKHVLAAGQAHLCDPHERANHRLRHQHQQVVSPEDIEPQRHHKNGHRDVIQGQQGAEKQAATQQLEPKCLLIAYSLLSFPYWFMRNEVLLGRVARSWQMKGMV